MGTPFGDTALPQDEGADGLVAAARLALAAGRWMEALDLASQALGEDPTVEGGAQLVGAARKGLGAASALGVELRPLTVMAVDMVRSTAIAAGVGPEVWREFMMDLYGVCADAIARNDGRVTKYVGDGVLAQFGHPVAHEDDGRRAVLSALAIIDAVEELATRWEARLGERAAVRIGLDAGTVAVGPVGTSPWAPDEIAGDAPNVASRVQTTAEPMTVRVTDAVQEGVAGWFETEPVGAVELRNYPRPIGLHHVLRATEAENRLEASARPRPALIGRDEERQTLLDAWGQVVIGGERRVVLLTGAGGIGKSRLAEHVMATAVAAGALPITFACSTLQRDTPFRPVIRALRRLFRLTAGDTRADSEVLAAIGEQLEHLPHRSVPLDQAVAVYGRLLGLDITIDLQPDALRRLTLDALVDLFEALAVESNVLLHVDDADTADPSTLELLTVLLSRPPTRTLVLLTGRTAPLLPAADATIELRGLLPSDAAALAAAVAPDLDDGTLGRVVARCGGIPFYLEELAHNAADSGREVLGEIIELSTFLAARLDELGPELRGVVGEIAIAGDEVRVDALRAMSSLAEEELTTAIGQLESRGIVRRSRTYAGEVVRFRHGVLRETAYATLLESRRRDLHDRFARVLESLPVGAVRPEDLAGHHALALNHGDAARCWLEAGRAAGATGAMREAAELFAHCLTQLAQLPDGPERAGAELEAQLGLGNAASTVEGYASPRARAAFERAGVLAEGFDDSTAIFPALWGTWTYWFLLGEHATAATFGARCLAIAEQEADDPRFRWAAGAVVGYQALYLGDFELARSELALAANHIGVEPVADFPQDPGIVSRSALSAALWFLGEHAESAAVAQRALADVDALDPRGRRTAFTHSWVACTLAWRAELAGDSPRAIELADRAAAIAGQNGYATWLGAATLHRSIAQCTLGQVAEGLPVLAYVVDAWEAVGRAADGTQDHPVLMTPYFAGRLAQIQAATGDAAAARTRVDALLASTARSGEHFWDAELRRLKTTLTASEDTTA